MLYTICVIIYIFTFIIKYPLLSIQIIIIWIPFLYFTKFFVINLLLYSFFKYEMLSIIYFLYFIYIIVPFIYLTSIYICKIINKLNTINEAIIYLDKEPFVYNLKKKYIYYFFFFS